MSKNAKKSAMVPAPNTMAQMTEVTSKKPGLILSTSGDAGDATINLNAELVRTAFGSDDSGFCEGLFNQVVQMTAENGRINAQTLNFVGGALTEINPRNGREALLAAQIVANHLLAMKMARLAMGTNEMERLQKIEAMSTKMMRTTTTQMEALHKLRNGGKQKVVVEHVHVHEGGQAIVGNVDRGVG